MKGREVATTRSGVPKSGTVISRIVLGGGCRIAVMSSQSPTFTFSGCILLRLQDCGGDLELLFESIVEDEVGGAEREDGFGWEG
jgi:hypothetical protein